MWKIIKDIDEVANSDLDLTPAEDILKYTTKVRKGSEYNA